MKNLASLCSVSLLVLSAWVVLSAWGCTVQTDSNFPAALDIMEAMPRLSPSEIEGRLAKVPSGIRSSDLFDTAVVEPTRLFDDVYFLGYTGVGVFVIKTTKGLILIDSMWRPQDAVEVIESGLNALNLDPRDIKQVVVTHGHADHYGSARYFEQVYGAQVLMSRANWEFMRSAEAPTLTDPFGNLSTEIPLPLSFTELKNGDEIVLGDTRIAVVLTPGHTPGTVSLLLPVTEGGTPHMAAIWGGTGLPDTLAANQDYLESLNAFESLSQRAGVDTDLSTHPFVHDQLSKMASLRERGAGRGNPLVIGATAFGEYVQSELRAPVKKKIARLGSQ